MLAVWALAGALSGVPEAEAAPDPLLAREALFVSADHFPPKISPDGKKIAYLALHQGVASLWLKTLGSTEADEVVIHDPRAPILDFLWQTDSEHLLFFKDSDGGQNWHVYQTHLGSRNVRDLTAFFGVKARLVAADSRFPDQILVAMNLRERALSDIYRINLRHGGVLLDTEAVGDVVSWVADGAMQIRGALAVLPDGSTEIRARDDVRSVWHRVMRWPAADGGGSVHGFSPDGKSLYVTTAADANATRLLQVDVVTGKRTVLAEDPIFDVGGVMLGPVQKEPQAVLFSKEREEWRPLTEALKPDFEAVRAAVPGDVQVLSRDAADRRWVVSSQAGHLPASYHLFDRSGKRAELLFTSRESLTNLPFAEVQPFSFNSRDGLKLHGYRTLPRGVEPKALPTVLLVHAGPWLRDGWQFNNEVQWLANRGYAVVQLNYRGSSGFGRAHMAAGEREWGGKMLEDLVDAKNWAVNEGFADAKRVGIYGMNYGGYAVLSAMAFAPLEFACGVDLFGPSDLAALVNSIPPSLKITRGLFEKRVGSPEADEALLKARSPLFHAERIARPVLVAQGGKDPQTRAEDTERWVAQTRRGGVSVEYLNFPEETSGFSTAANVLKFYEAAEAFLAKHLGGRALPASPGAAKP